jgi:DnaJ like chaperone protein
MWFGKIIGGLIGMASGGIFGLLIGIVAGHYFDKALSGHRKRMTPEERARLEDTFFRSVFQLMGHLAKADGRVSEAEIAHTEQLMSRMSLRSDHRVRAIALFKEGVNGQVEIVQIVAEFREVCGNHPALAQQLLNYLLSLSLADGAISADEEALLRQIAKGLGISTLVFDQILRMIRAQTHFGGGQGHYQRHEHKTPSRDELSLAYDALGVREEDSDAVIKKAYRKLMSENHPDKLTGEGMPEDMIKLATERTQEIQTAYDLIKKYRAAG